MYDNGDDMILYYVTDLEDFNITILERAGSPVDSSWRLGAFLRSAFYRLY
jgi:hypothetical protein